MNSAHADRLAHVRATIDSVLKKTEVGRADRVVRMPLLDIARENAEAWVAIYPPREELGETGGSTSPGELREGKERAEVYALAAHAAQRLREIPKELERLTGEMHSLVARVGERIDHTKLPNKAVPGCTSCARTQGSGASQLGGHFAPVYEKSQKSGLCRWCYDFARANDGRRPPIKACDIYHREGPRQAGTWLARNERTWRDDEDLTEPAGRRCPSRHLDPSTDLEYACTLARDHNGLHQAALVTGARLTWNDAPPATMSVVPPCNALVAAADAAE